MPKTELRKLTQKKLKTGININAVLTHRVRWIKTNICVFVGFIISNIISYFFLPATFHVYYLYPLYHGKLFNQFDITLFWIFTGGFVFHFNCVILSLLTDEIFKSKSVKEKIRKARKVFIGFSSSTWLAMFYTQWDGVYFANTGNALIGNDFALWIPVCILAVTTLLCGWAVRT